jgi:hypothetical protein
MMASSSVPDMLCKVPSAKSDREQWPDKLNEVVLDKHLNSLLCLVRSVHLQVHLNAQR